MEAEGESQEKLDARPNDKPTKVAAHLGFRFGYTLLAWVILAIGQSPGKGYYTALFMFAVPLFADYCRFKPDKALRVWIRRLGMWLTGLYMLIGFLGAFEALDVVLDNNKHLVAVVTDKFLVGQGLSLPLSFIWYSVGIGVVLTAVDCVIWESNAEREVKKLISENASA